MIVDIDGLKLLFRLDDNGLPYVKSMDPIITQDKIQVIYNDSTKPKNVDNVQEIEDWIPLVHDTVSTNSNSTQTTKSNNSPNTNGLSPDFQFNINIVKDAIRQHNVSKTMPANILFKIAMNGAEALANRKLVSIGNIKLGSVGNSSSLGTINMPTDSSVKVGNINITGGQSG